MLVEVCSTLNSSVFSSSFIKKTAEKIYNTLSTKKKLRSCYPKPADAELSILVVADSKMKSLNSEYRKKNKTTDVLSFSMIEECASISAASSSHLGDIVINLRQAQRQSKARGVSLKRELQWLIVHGILHLVGYDHEKSEYDDAEMRKLEDEILTEI
ncbi:MAG: rRNA maturation RNase YbeY [Nitrospirae bacterium]|nr:rRNA maturation RNase YbeY [Nitrospirota bacterium]